MEDKKQALREQIEGIYLQHQKDGDFYIPDRIYDNTGFLTLFKDSLFHYNNGIFLCERIFHSGAVQFEERKMLRESDENKAVYEDFVAYVNASINDRTVPQDEISKRIEEFKEKILEGGEMVDIVKLPYHELTYGAKNKILLKKIADIEKESLHIMSGILANFVMILCESLFFTASDEYEIVIGTAPFQDLYTDIIALIAKK